MTTVLVSAFLWLAAGALAGGVYWLSLRWSVARLVAGRSVAAVIALQLVRFALLGAALAMVRIHGGALALLLSTGGLLVARTGVLRLATRG